MQLWTITDIATGAVLSTAFSTPSTGSHPKDNGWAWDAAKHKATRIAAQPETDLQAFDGTAWSYSPNKVEAELIAMVKAESERRTMLVYTPNRGKIDFRALSGEGALATLLNAAFAALPSAAKKRKFIYAQADAARRGDTVADAIGRFEAGMNQSEASVASLKAVESAACSAIRAAATVAAKRSAYNAINWAWSPN
jgi:hypothetical protein